MSAIAAMYTPCGPKESCACLAELNTGKEITPLLGQRKYTERSKDNDDAIAIEHLPWEL